LPSFLPKKLAAGGTHLPDKSKFEIQKRIKNNIYQRFIDFCAKV